MWTWFPPVVPTTPWKHIGCYSGEVPLTYHVADFCTCHNKPGAVTMTMEKCFASCKGAGFRYAGLKGNNGGKACWCGSADPSEYKLPNDNTCNVPCGEGEGDSVKGYNVNKCGGKTTYSIYKDTCYKKFDVDEAPLGYESSGCWSGHGGWLLAHAEKSVSGDNLSIDSCVEACSSNGYAYAGMRNGWECFCGGRLSPHFVDVHQKNPQHNTMCTKVCSATWKVYATTPKEEWQYCGGDVYYSLYYNRNLDASTTCDADDDEVTTTVKPATKTATKSTKTITVTKGGPEPDDDEDEDDEDKVTRTTVTVEPKTTKKVTQTITVTKGGPPPTEDEEEYDEDKTTRVRTTITAKNTKKVTQTITVTKGGPPPTEDDEDYDEDKTTRVRTTVPGKTTNKVTQTITVTKGAPPPTEDDEDYDEDKTTRVRTTITAKNTKKVTQTITVTKGGPPPTEDDEDYDEDKTTRVRTTVPGKTTNKVTQTITVTKGAPPPTEDDEDYDEDKTTRVRTTITAKNTKKVTQTITVTKGGPPPTEDDEDYDEDKTTRVRTTVPGKTTNKTTRIRTTVPKPTGKPTSTTKPTDPKPTDEPEEPEEEDDGNPGGKGGEPDDEGKPDDKGAQPDDTLCKIPAVPQDVVKNTKWKNVKFPVGGVKAPAVSCHNDKGKHKAGYHFKLYVGPGTAWPNAVCRVDYLHKPTEIQAACWNACIEQKKDCVKSPAVKKLANYQDLCEAQLLACKDANTYSLFKAAIDKINDGYCKDPAPPFPKPPDAGGKSGDDDDEEEDISYF
ncbi:uncharacterized protein DFL_008711 [Arthrobotrys flagrans]|uniref:WSC domain-containing protein n=1 Tax=Arthrobotrys flagrans TaxID=97331 RepID=A0A436ZPU5_ARTFL|nr:hypothetical protein DFL_008711 [Arthrobotrys flagrans]